MRVLLINPPYNIPIETRASPPLGLAYLVAISERRGDEVRVWDGEVDPEPLEKILEEFRPEVVGITATTVQIKMAWKTAERVKKALNVPVVLGGVHPTLMPEESISHPAVDVVVRGEGEETWEELTSSLEKGFDPEALRQIRGLTFRTPSGEIISTPDRPIIMDLDSLPFPSYRPFKMHLYTNLQPTIDHLPRGRSFPIMTSRGCPYRCSYCSQISPRRWRMRSPENVLAEWRWLVRDMGALEIGVLDDTFNVDRERVIRICDLLIREKLNHVPWIMINGIRANLVDKELLRKMREAGCIRVAFGVESGDQRILDEVIHKQLTLEQVRNAFKWAKEVGLETIGFFIIGLPGETEETMEKTIRFAIELDPLVANFSIATPFPGTEMYEVVRREGKLLIKDWDDFAFFEGKAHFEMPGMPAELVEKKWREAYRRFYLRPKRVLKTLMRKRTWLDLPRTLKVAWKTITGYKRGRRNGNTC